MAFNRPLNSDLAVEIFNNKQFVEAIIAPEMALDFLEMYSEKKNVRLLVSEGINPGGNEVEYRSVEGGLLCQEIDTANEDPLQFKVVTQRKPDVEEMDELIFAWKACKSVKSNAIVLAKDFCTIGIGPGQPNRINSAMIAVAAAEENAKGSFEGVVCASDAFFPFRDGLDVLGRAGVKAIIQPGGSIRDDEVIAAADEQGIAMVFTGHRHFRH
jgi:phosphoribosylaminoimidazolecarboxamide formyltransferase/IMP cyclohydrolase